MIVKRLTVYDPALIQADFPGTQFIAGRKSAIKPKSAFEYLGMMPLIKVNEQLADVTPHLLADCGKAFQSFDALPVRKKEFVNLCQGRILMVCSFEYLL